MKNRENWQPSKYVYRKGKLIASRDTNEVSVGSRLITDLIAECYEKYIRQYAKGRLLDLGCGKVPLYCAYKDYVEESICVDWKNTLHHSEYLDYECDITEDLPFENDEFDSIILSDVLEHLPRQEHIWMEMYRILAKDGKLMINVPFFYWLHEQPHDYYRFTEYALRRFVDGSGLRLVELQAFGGTPEILADILAKNVQPIKPIGNGLANAIQCFTELFMKTKLGRKISDKTCHTFPLGYFVIAEKTK